MIKNGKRHAGNTNTALDDLPADVRGIISPPEANRVAKTKEVDSLPRCTEIKAPMGELGAGYVTRHIDTQLTVRQSENLRKLLVGLRTANEKTADQRPVENVTQAVRWILEQLG